MDCIPKNNDDLRMIIINWLHNIVGAVNLELSAT